VFVWRLVLCLGLVVHKLIWEFLKQSNKGANPAHKPPVTERVKSILKIIKVVVLASLVIQTLFMNLFPFKRDSFWRRAIGGALFFGGLITAIAGRLHLGNNWANIEDYQVLPQQSLVTSGIYRYVRHPIYAGDMLLLVGLQLALNSKLLFAMFVPLLIIGKQAIAEESILAKKFPTYDDYSSQTKRFIPYVI
jgi:protein-S-isoprenylcysteine O-methyltransferase Ste14